MSVRNRRWSRRSDGEPQQSEKEALTLARTIQFHLLNVPAIEEAIAQHPSFHGYSPPQAFRHSIFRDNNDAPTQASSSVAKDMLEVYLQQGLRCPGTQNSMDRSAALDLKDKNDLRSMGARNKGKSYSSKRKEETKGKGLQLGLGVTRPRTFPFARQTLAPASLLRIATAPDFRCSGLQPIHVPPMFCCRPSSHDINTARLQSASYPSDPHPPPPKHPADLQIVSDVGPLFASPFDSGPERGEFKMLDANRIDLPEPSSKPSSAAASQMLPCIKKLPAPVANLFTPSWALTLL